MSERMRALKKRADEVMDLADYITEQSRNDKDGGYSQDGALLVAALITEETDDE